MSIKRDFAIFVIRSARKKIDGGSERTVVYGGELSLDPVVNHNEVFRYEGTAYFVNATERRQIKNLSIYQEASTRNPHYEYDFVIRSGNLPQGPGLLTNRHDSRFIYEGDVEFQLTPCADLPRLREMSGVAVDSINGWFGLLLKRRDWFRRTHWHLSAYTFTNGQLKLPEHVVALNRFWDDDGPTERSAWEVGTIVRTQAD